ncbi:MAG: ParB/RepB/Spo0J family partition protein [Deltaproteobacteria bacterium]|jgi:ParB/RepB/Spo0J family partition protein|nr:ParB/RepB/Spo0J family partition protein [Deltaproteobacteria bacterium]
MADASSKNSSNTDPKTSQPIASDCDEPSTAETDEILGKPSSDQVEINDYSIAIASDMKDSFSQLDQITVNKHNSSAKPDKTLSAGPGERNSDYDKPSVNSLEGAALIPHLASTVISNEILLIDIAKIDPDPNQPRKFFDDETLENLKASIKSSSLHQPIFIRANGQNPERYFIIDGQRRWQACLALNHAVIQCRIVESDAKGYQLLALTANIQRDNLLPIERANALAAIWKTIKEESADAHQNDLANLIHESPSSVSELLKISELNDYIKEEAIKSREWSYRKLKALSIIKDPQSREEQFKKAQATINKKLGIIIPANETGIDNNSVSDSDADSNSKANKPSDSNVVFQKIKSNVKSLTKRVQAINATDLQSSQKKEIKTEIKGVIDKLKSLLAALT